MKKWKNKVRMRGFFKCIKRKDMILRKYIFIFFKKWRDSINSISPNRESIHIFFSFLKCKKNLSEKSHITIVIHNRKENINIFFHVAIVSGFYIMQTTFLFLCTLFFQAFSSLTKADIILSILAILVLMYLSHHHSKDIISVILSKYGYIII